MILFTIVMTEFCTYSPHRSAHTRVLDRTPHFLLRLAAHVPSPSPSPFASFHPPPTRHHHFFAVTVNVVRAQVLPKRVLRRSATTTGTYSARAIRSQYTRDRSPHSPSVGPSRVAPFSRSAASGHCPYRPREFTRRSSRQVESNTCKPSTTKPHISRNRHCIP